MNGHPARTAKKDALLAQIKHHRIGIQAPSENIDWNPASQHEVRSCKCSHELGPADEFCAQRGAVPENERVGAEIAAIDGHGERYAVNWHGVRGQRRYRGWRELRSFQRTAGWVFNSSSASDGE